MMIMWVNKLEKAKLQNLSRNVCDRIRTLLP